VSRRYYRGRRGNIIAAIWLIGLGLLALTDQWWPGILILVGLSMVVNAVIPAAERPPRRPGPPRPSRPPAGREDDYSYLEEPFPDEGEPPLQVKVPDPKPAQKGVLPSNCPMCGAPVDAAKITHSPSGAPLCAYCEADLTI
jgi:hypothetical protein